MPTSSPSANKILVDLAIARESARVSAEDAQIQRRMRAVKVGYLALALKALSEQTMPWPPDFEMQAEWITSWIERAGSASPER
jgi:hypothetical protein